MKTTTIQLDSNLALLPGDIITFEGVRDFNILQKLIRLFFKTAFEKSADLKKFTIAKRTETSIEIYPASHKVSNES